MARKAYTPGIRKVTETPNDYEQVKATFPIGKRIFLNGYGGVTGGVEGEVRGYRRTKYQGTLVCVEYRYTWSDGYSEMCKAFLTVKEIGK